MITLDRYLVGCAALAAVLVALAFGAYRLRQRLMPQWTGPPARLAEITLALSILILIAQALGAVGLFKAEVVIPALIAAGLAAGVLAGSGGTPRERLSEAGAPREAPGDGLSSGSPPAPPNNHMAIAAALLATAFIVALWSLDIQRNLDRGMYGFDTLWYHMPFSADYVQSASVTGLHFTDPLYLNWFYPANSELVHGIGILFFDRDLLSPVLNLGWLGVALLAAWCIGRPYGVAPLSLIAVIALMGAHTLETGQPGDAKNDIVGIALLMSAVAVLLNADPGLRDRANRVWPAGPLIVAGLAAGLAAGTKLDMLAAVAALSVGVVVVAGPGTRRAVMLAFGIPLALAGSFWYLRNLFTVGNPLPWIEHLGPIALPHPDRPIEGRAPFTVAHYLFDWSIYSDYFFPGLKRGFGKVWPVLVGLAMSGILLAALRGRTRVIRMTGAFVAFAVVAYLFTPLSASGPEGMPVGFFLNLRYVAPALVIGLALLPLALARRPPPTSSSSEAGPAPFGQRPMTYDLVFIGIFALLIFITDKPRAIPNSLYTTGSLVFAAVLVVLPFVLYLLARRGGEARALPILVGLVLAALTVTAGWRESKTYLENRYTLTPYSTFGLDRPFQWARDQHNARIGLAGTTIAFFQYGLYGTDVSNRVDYVGKRTPHGGLEPITTCQEFRQTVNDRGYGFVVTSPFLNQNEQTKPIESPEREWLRSDPAAQKVLRDDTTTIFEITRPLDPAACAALGPRARITIDSLKPAA